MKKTCVLFFAVFAVGCVGEFESQQSREQSTAIVGGATFDGLPAVGAMTVNGSPACTGTLIEPRKVLTAAHCVEGLRGNVQFVFGPSAFRPDERIQVVAAVAHPDYNRSQLTSDIAYLELASDASVQPMEIQTEPMDQTWVGRDLLFVGYGATDGFSGGGGGLKRAVTMDIDQVAASQFAYIDANKNTCFGDSGGPAFYRDPQTQILKVAGVTSYGDQNCNRYGVDTRVDAFVSFLDIAPPAPVVPIDPCGGESFEGRCQGSTVVWCENEEVISIDCNRCGFQPGRGIYNCL